MDRFLGIRRIFYITTKRPIPEEGATAVSQCELPHHKRKGLFFILASYNLNF